MRRSAVVLSCLLSTVALGWGFDGHRRLSSLMQNPLPGNHCLRAWYSARQTAALQDSSCNPDRWRATDSNEWPRHFLEIDRASPPANYPRSYADAQDQFRNFAIGNGQVPWRVEEVYGQLVAAFRAKNEAEILRISFVLSHYVTDAFSVLHDTSNSDPNNGLHSRWESDMLDVNANINGITQLSATLYGTPGKADPKHNIFDVVLVGNGLVNQLIAADTAANKAIPALYTGTRELTARRWADALTVMASMLWTAWAEAGAPALTGFSTTCDLAKPTADIVLRGYPVPGGFTHPDPAYFGPVDAGTPATGGGAGGGSATGGGSGESSVDGGTTPEETPVGCACSSLDGTALLAAGAITALRRRRAPRA